MCAAGYPPKCSTCVRRIGSIKTKTCKIEYISIDNLHYGISIPWLQKWVPICTKGWRKCVLSTVPGEERESLIWLVCELNSTISVRLFDIWFVIQFQSHPRKHDQSVCRKSVCMKSVCRKIYYTRIHTHTTLLHNVTLLIYLNNKDNKKLEIVYES